MPNKYDPSKLLQPLPLFNKTFQKHSVDSGAIEAGTYYPAALFQHPKLVNEF